MRRNILYDRHLLGNQPSGPGGVVLRDTERAMLRLLMPIEIETLFHDLLALSDVEREARLEELRRTRPELHRELLELLGAAESSRDFLRPQTSADTTPPETLGKYAVSGELGRGAAGVVYLARDPDLGRDVALKVLVHAPSPALEEELRREARALAAIVHPNVAQVYSVETTGTKERVAFLTMEFVPGAALGERVRFGALPVEVALDHGRQIASALEAAHLRGLIHRDLKPYNIRVTPDGWVKVLDFGLAFGMRQTSEGSVPSGGTPGYMSPEQCRREALDPRSDLWSFGAVLFECLTGEPAIEGSEIHEVFAANRAGHVDLTRLPRSVPSRTVHLLERALDPNPSTRLDSATTARQVLEEELLRLRALSFVLAEGMHVPAEAPRPGKDVESSVAQGNLPRPLSSFIGRADWLEQTTKRVHGHTLVTVTGPGGVGKTRTSIELAHRVRPSFPGGVWIVDLASVGRGIDAPAAVLRALGISELSGTGQPRTPAQGVAAMFSENAGLLLVDNCEHVVDGIARFLEDLLTRESKLTVLTTSRTPIGVPGEEVVILPPLSTAGLSQAREGEPASESRRELESEAIELYLQRARSRAPSFEIDEDGLATIREICLRLDGLPLAIELAASQARSLPLGETLRRVREGRSLGAPTTAPQRHQSLKDLVAWSHRLLRPKEQALLERMTVFRGGCTLAAIEAVCGDWGGIERWEVCDLVARLVEASLVEPVDLNLADTDRGETRYRLLETIRMFCAEELTRRPDSRELALQLETAYLEFVSRLIVVRPEEDGPTRTVWLTRIGPDYPNVLHALDTALDRGRLDIAYQCGDLLTYYWFQSGQWTVGRRWLDRILEARSRHQEAERREGSQLGEVPTASAIDAVDAERANGHRAAEARFLAQSGFLDSVLGRGTTSSEELEAAIEICADIEDHSAIAFVQQIAGITCWKRMELDNARTHILQSLHHAKMADDRGAVVAAYGNLGVIESAAGNNERSLEYYEQHLAESRKMGDHGAVAAALGNIAWANWALGRLELAMASMREVVALFSASDNLPNLVMARANLGEILLSAGDLDGARKELLESGRLRIEIGDQVGLATSIFSLCRVTERRGRIEEAAALACVVDGLGGRNIMTYPGQVMTSEEWKAALLTRLSDAARLEARNRLAGKDLTEVFRIAEEWSR